MAGTTVNVSIRMDAGLKMEAEELFSELGLSFGAAVQVFVRQALRRGGLPFKVTLGKSRNGDLQATKNRQTAQEAAGREAGQISQGTRLTEEETQKEYANLEEFFAKLDAG